MNNLELDVLIRECKNVRFTLSHLNRYEYKILEILMRHVDGFAPEEDYNMIHVDYDEETLIFNKGIVFDDDLLKDLFNKLSIEKFRINNEYHIPLTLLHEALIQIKNLHSSKTNQKKTHNYKNIKTIRI